jgi:putative membrane protein
VVKTIRFSSLELQQVSVFIQPRIWLALVSVIVTNRNQARSKHALDTLCSSILHTSMKVAMDMNKRQRTTLSWVLIAIYAIVTILRKSFAPNLLPAPISTALVTFVPLIFIFVHGSLSYRLRDLLVFAAITLVVSNIFENMSVLTGFPFGHYYYTDTLGPKVFLVPVLIGPAYLGTGYLAWTIARVISGATHSRLPGHLTFTVPLLASFMMVSWDLSFDPIFSTINHGWIWLDGGSYFGVPFSNFLGWLLTTFVFLQLFALYLKGRPNVQSIDEQPSRIQSLQAILFYGLIAVGYLLNSLTRNTSGTVTDPAGTVWRLQDIYVVTGLVAIFTMGVFTILGVVKLMAVSPAVQNASLEAAPISSMPYSPERQID